MMLIFVTGGCLVRHRGIPPQNGGDVVYLWEEGVYFRFFFISGSAFRFRRLLSLSFWKRQCEHTCVTTRDHYILSLSFIIRYIVLYLSDCWLIYWPFNSFYDNMYIYNPTFGNFLGITPMHTIQIRGFNFPKVISVRFVHAIFQILKTFITFIFKLSRKKNSGVVLIYFLNNFFEFVKNICL